MADAARASVLLSAIRHLLLRRSFCSDPVRVRAPVRDLGEPAPPDPGAGPGARERRVVRLSDRAPARSARGVGVGLHRDVRAAPLGAARRLVRLSSDRADDPALARGVLLLPHTTLDLALDLSSPPRRLSGRSGDYRGGLRRVHAGL